MGNITLLTGGARSGKSTQALVLAAAYKTPRAFIATAEAFDDEMRARIAKHREERAGEFVTLEAPYDLAQTIASIDRQYGIAVIDCITVWLGNMFFRHQDDDGAITGAVDDLCTAITHQHADQIIVTNEVGMGIVPENALARRFRDMQGYANRKIAECAGAVFLCCCGIPVKIK